MATKKTPEQQLEALVKRKDEIDARIKKKTAQVRSKERKEDTRRKIIAGGIALKHMAHDTKFRATMQKLIEEHVTRENDRKLFDL